MRTLIKRLLFPFLSRWYRRKNSSVQYYSRFGIRLKILPTVFHPGYFLSTGILVHFLSDKELRGKKLLELGAGNGMVSLFAAKNGAIVTATDINPAAIEGLRDNAQQNELSITVLEVDLLEGISVGDFDYIIINPPYYPQQPTNLAESAFYCGEDFDYFNRLFDQLSQQAFSTKTSVFMILSEDCEIAHILNLAAERGIAHETVFETRKRGEKNTIFRLFHP